MRIANVLLALVLVSCVNATTRVKLDRQLKDAKGEPLGNVTLTNDDATADEAVRILKAAREYEVIASGGDVAKGAVAQGIPVTLSAGDMNVSTGGLYTTGYGAFANDPAYAPLVAAERQSFAFSPYGHAALPPLEQRGPAPPAQVAPQGAIQSAPPAQVFGNGREACPMDRDPATEGERITCLEKSRTFMMRKLDGR